MFSFRVGTEELARRKTVWLEVGFNTPGNMQQLGSDQRQFPSSRNLRLMRAPVAGLALLNERKQRIRGAGEQRSFNGCLQGVFNGGKGFAVPNLLQFKRDAAQLQLMLDTAGGADIALIQI